jgi:thioredoxin-like negative regulator of GroEL
MNPRVPLGGPGFRVRRDGHHERVTDATTTHLPVLLFVGQRQSGPSRRMESLVASVKVNRKARLRVVEVDADRRSDLVRRFGIRELPSLVLLDRTGVVARLEGRATGHEIDELLRRHLAA